MYKAFWRIVTLFITTIALISLACQGGGLSTPPPEKAPSQEDGGGQDVQPPQAEPTQPALPEMQNGKVGDIFQSGDITLFVLGWDNVTALEYTKPDAGKKFISTDVIMVNAGKTPAYFSSFDFYLKDNAGQKYDLHATATTSARSDFLAGVELSPGERLWTRIGYQVPENAAGLQLIYDSRDESTAKIFVDLGDGPHSVSLPAKLPGESEQQVYPSDQTVEVNGLFITVNGASYSNGTEYLKPPAGTQWVVVDVTIENKSGSSINFMSYVQLLLRDSRGWLCLHVPGPVMATGGSEPNGEITSGEKIRGQVGFEVPDGSTGLVLMYDEDANELPPKVSIALSMK